MSELNADERQRQGEALLREAHLFRVRQDLATAEERCRGALELLPDDAGAVEMLGDLLAAQGARPAEVLALYQRALDLAPGSESLEVKIAKAILVQGEEAHLRQQADRLLAGGPISPQARKRQVTVATLLSLVLPGAGQIYNRDALKAAIILPVWLAAMSLGYPELLRLVVTLLTMAQRFETNGPAIVLGLIGVVTHIYAVLDAAARAEKLGAVVDAGR